jgi:HD superfamily phosphohydrolase
MLVSHVCSQLNLSNPDLITPVDERLIQDLIKGESEHYMSKFGEEKAFLFDIVANKRNSFDLDKLDYLNRDLRHTQINKSRI